MWWWLGVALAADADSDGYDASVDCDDLDPRVNPGATEVCGGGDEDCDGLVDDGDPSVEQRPFWHTDADGDGYVGRVVAHACHGPPGSIRHYHSSRDCDDHDPAVWNGYAVWYADADGDGYPSSTWFQGCHPPSPAWSLDIVAPADCEDADPDSHPGAADPCGDGVDQDCDGRDAVCPWWGATWTGSGAFEGFGARVEWVEDATGDGVPDAWVGGGNAEEAWLMPGPLDRDLDEADAWLTLTVASPGAWDALDGLASGFDADGDGLDDVVVGSTGVRVGFVDVAGAVYVIRGGGVGTRRVDQAARTILDGGAYGQLGAQVAVGDWDGGAPEVFASAPYLDGAAGVHAGAIYVVSSFPLGHASIDALAAVRIEGAVPQDHVGEVSLLVGDTDTDGADDLAFDDYLFRHAPTGIVSAATADVTFAGYQPDLVVDLDGDGANELVGGVSQGVWVVPGSTGAALAPIATIAFDPGFSLVRSSSGDLDGDGRADLAVGYRETGASARSGVLVFAGPLAGVLTEADAAAVLAAPHDDDAAAEPAAGDLDGDGVDDLLVGSSRSGRSIPGLVYVASGPLF